MAMQYSQQGFYDFAPQWPDEVKPALTEDNSSVLDDRVLDSSTPADMTAAAPIDNGHLAMPKVEDDFSGPTQVWQERPQAVMNAARHYSQPSMSLANVNTSFFAQPPSANCGSAFAQTPSWPLTARSEASTPTPFFAAAQDQFNQQVQYPGGPVTLSTFAQQDPLSAVSMSPQSSQGGWASTTSSNATERSRRLRHHKYRAPSPGLVVRSDGIRKKNAKFDIPSERNLANIDLLIASCVNDEEKKELKQQKRLLRNRQAALDSRQRKKSHTEKLEQEKKIFTDQKNEMENTIAHLEATLLQEREQWARQRQQCEQYIQRLQYERDEAIRTKTLDTADLRRQNNILKDTVRDLERHQHIKAFSNNPADAFTNDFTNFRSLDLEDTWDSEFSLINPDDLKLEENESLQRQATPRPPTSTQHVGGDSLDVKVDAGFSWNTFYMCLLAGAFIVSQTGSSSTNAATSAAVITSTMPALADDYRAEAGNVLNAVLASSAAGAHEALPSRPAAANMDHSNYQQANLAQSDRVPNAGRAAETSLDSLHATLTTPSRQQQTSAAFSLSASSYNHIANGDSVFDDDSDDVEIVEVKPTRLQQLFANMQAERDGIDKMAGMSSKACERSVLLDRVPEKVLRDFREMIARVE
ncbi:hypothetical protein PV08_02834 [Exophiala spinifera]|uniref:BZIP domain-containing protein n=1 Tax=Exophiala spinifera TaxID=91928 RepID=A0A0D1YTK4_9EURO|nr:uncharacterized protein PV08_02834 [Exophiala spinifera]KIW18546.1 hypothetical protein PV08_02834 [Exophiala spinifera]